MGFWQCLSFARVEGIFANAEGIFANVEGIFANVEGSFVNAEGIFANAKGTRQRKQCGFSIYIFDNSKSKSMVRLEKMALSGLVFARKIARMILIQNI